MGNFFTSTQIYNEGMVKSEKFTDMFCKAMKKEGYVTCEGDESEKSYILRFADNCKWVTITSEDYEQGNQTAHSDTGRIAQMLGTTCVNTTVIDSDCAVMEMYGSNGKKADTLIMGRADDYFGENIPLPAENAWKPFLADSSSWKKLCDIVKESENYTFVEEGLSDLASIIGMDEENITFSAENAEEDKQTVFLKFKKVAAKKEKKLTLKAAFEQVYGEALEPLGFIYAKTKKPCFLRLVNDDIVHVVYLSDNSETLSIKSGIFTLYRLKINLNDHEMDNWWLHNTNKFFCVAHPHNIEIEYPNYNFYPYTKNNSLSIYYALKESLKEIKNWVIPVMDKVDNLNSFVNYQIIIHNQMHYHSACDKKTYERLLECDEGAIVFALDDPLSAPEFEKKYNLECIEYSHEHKPSRYVDDRYEEYVTGANERYNQNVELISNVMNNPDFYKQTKQELARRKAENLKTLKTYGVNI